MKFSDVSIQNPNYVRIHWQFEVFHLCLDADDSPRRRLVLCRLTGAFVLFDDLFSRIENQIEVLGFGELFDSARCLQRNEPLQDGNFLVVPSGIFAPNQVLVSLYGEDIDLTIV